MHSYMNFLSSLKCVREVKLKFSQGIFFLPSQEILIDHMDMCGGV